MELKQNQKLEQNHELLKKRCEIFRKESVKYDPASLECDVALITKQYQNLVPIALCLQNESFVWDSNKNNQMIIGTFGLGPCIAIGAIGITNLTGLPNNPTTKRGWMCHIDALTLSPLEELKRCFEGIEPANISIYMVVGNIQTRLQVSRLLQVV